MIQKHFSIWNGMPKLNLGRNLWSTMAGSWFEWMREPVSNICSSESKANRQFDCAQVMVKWDSQPIEEGWEN